MKSRKFWKRLIALVILVPVALFATVITLLYQRQETVVQELISTLNEDFRGRIELDGSHIAPFANFPYISVDLENLRIFETKDQAAAAIAEFKDLYVGFDLWTILAGRMELKSIRINEGHLDMIVHPDGTLNVSNAFEPVHEIADVEEEFHLDLKEIKLNRVDINKRNEADSIVIDAFIDHATSRFRTDEKHTMISLDASTELSLVISGDTTVIKHKNLDIETQIDYNVSEQFLLISPTVATLEGAEFNTSGSIDLDNDLYVDLVFEGNKPNFDLFIAMAPDDLIPTLKRYENAGRVFFEASVKGPTAHGKSPAINARFGCENAYVNNYTVNKKLDQLNFTGYFTNGDSCNIRTMEMALRDFTARPEAGTFSGNLVVKNFESPDINLQLNSDFQLDFLAKFFNIPNLEEYSGRVMLTMNFHDIIDLAEPERSIERLNESYFTQLKLEDLSFKLSSYDLTVRDIDLFAEVTGHEAHIDYFNMSAGESDLSIQGSISDLPAILHHTDLPIEIRLAIHSNSLNLFELTGSDSIDSPQEHLKDVSFGFHFNSTAKNLTESPHLPVGEFFIDNLHARLTHYPHELHDFHADIFIDERDFRVVDFKGMIDQSDFLFSGKIANYDLWFQDKMHGDTRMEFDLTSDLLQLDDVFSYRGANYVPEDYRHEEFRQLRIHGYTDLHFEDSLRSVDLSLDRFDAKLNVHPMRMENFQGRVHLEDEHLNIEQFSGKIGKSDFEARLKWYLGNNKEEQKKYNEFELKSRRLDFDELFAYSPPPASQSPAVSHDSVFNIYTLPFTDLRVSLDIDHLNYHTYLIHNFDATLRTTPDHKLMIDRAHLEAADGSFEISGYFDGSDPNRLILVPDLTLTDVDLDKLMLKFDNFGQDHLVSENLHGTISGRVTGQVRMHTDLVPVTDKSQLHIEFEVTDGRLERYALLQSMSDYFKDKNLQSVRFDTLRNTLDFNQGVLNIPLMRINSSLGFIEISGTQDMNLNMDYYVRVPWQMVTDAAASRLFNRKKNEVDPSQEDEIISADDGKKVRFVNVRVKGTPDDFQITLEKAPRRK